MFFLKLLIVGVLLASCGGGNSAVTPAQVTITPSQVVANTIVSLSGVVVDGYMKGATVFVDRNNNGVQDTTEPFSVTNAKGAFQLTGLKKGDENYPIVADVPATAVDSDTGRIVGKHSLMNTPAPGILTQAIVISPITTLIKTVMDSTPNSDKYTAAQSVKKDLALSPNSKVDLFANYMILEANSSDYAKVHRVAQVVARTVARQANIVHQSALKSNANATFSDAISLITTQVMNQLPVIEKVIPVGTPSVVGLAWDAYTHSIAVTDTYTSPINLADTYTFNSAVNHQIQLTSAATQKAQALVANTSIQAALVLQDAYVQVVAQDAYSLALAMLKAPKVTAAQTSVVTQSLPVASANQSAVVVASAPVIALKGTAVQTVAQGSVFTDAGSTVKDNVDTGLTATVTGMVNTALIGTYTLTYNISDKSGNKAIAVKRTVKVTDQTAPTVTAPASITVAAVNINGTPATHAKISAFLIAPTAKDNVDVTSTVTNNAPTQFLLGLTTVTFTSIDKAGNQGTATATVNVADKTAPVITLKGTAVQTVAQGSVFTDAGSTVKDNVDTGLTATVTGKVNTVLLGTYVLTFTAKDKSGNKAIAVKRTVQVTDQTAPVVTAPTSITVAAVNVNGTPSSNTNIASFLLAATAKDNVDVTSTVTNNAPTQFLLGLTTVTFTSIDKGGNQGTATATVNVGDKTAPVITLKGTAVQTIAQGSVFTDTGSTVKDNVDTGLTATVTGKVNTALLGTYVLTFTAKDKSGNKALAVKRTVQVTVAKDNVPPVLTLIGNATVFVAVGSSYKDTGATALDNIDGNITAKIVVSNLVNSAVLGTYTVTYNIKDSVGNAATPLVRTVKVTDQTPPVVTAPKPLILTTLDTYAIAATDPYITAFLGQASATDNIDKVLTISNDAPVTFPVGVTTVTFRSIDKAGNQGTITATVTVQGRLFVGLTTRSLLLADITAWEGKSGHKVHRIQHFYDFSAPAYLWTNEVPSALNAGYKVVLTMEPRVGVNDGVTHLRDIYAGVMDPYIDATINGIKNNILATWPNADIWMRFGHEMNGDWYPWGSDFNQGTTVRHLGNTAQDYINAYRHVVDRFRAAGLGSNVVKWVFSPNVWYKDNISQFYPGNAYVDIISVSGFNFGTQATSQPTLTWQTFNQIHQLTYNLLTGLYPTKPYFIAGISSAELGGPTGQFGVDKATWIDDMTVQLSQAYPKLQGIFWFNENKKASGEADWRIDSSTQSLGATQRMYGKQGLWKP